jgi:elongation factor Tu
MSSDFTKISAKIYLLRTEEGGRKTPLFTGYRPAVYFGDRQTDGLIVFDCKDKPALGGEYTVMIALTHPEDLGDALRKDATFDFREGLKIIGRGKVLAVEETKSEPTR